MDQSSPTPLLVTETPAEIQAELAQRGIGFEQWPALQELPLEADQAQILNVLCQRHCPREAAWRLRHC
jgi:1,2-dihydroxy-3-keto-5-methylthiopentene dioxygenase